MIMSFSTSVISVGLEPLSLKYGLAFLQNSLLSATSLTFNLAKYYLKDSDKNFADSCIFAS